MTIVQPTATADVHVVVVAAVLVAVVVLVVVTVAKALLLLLSKLLGLSLRPLLPVGLLLQRRLHRQLALMFTST